MSGIVGEEGEGRVALGSIYYKCQMLNRLRGGNPARELLVTEQLSLSTLPPECLINTSK